MVGWPPGPFAGTSFLRRLALGWAALLSFAPPLVLLPVPMRIFQEIMIRGTPCFSVRFARLALFGGRGGLRWTWNSLGGACVASTLTTLSTFSTLSTTRLRAVLPLFHNLDLGPASVGLGLVGGLHMLETHIAPQLFPDYLADLGVCQGG